ncbi:MAG: hypothetical protein MPJ05_08380 [Nitrosopumilus sp.]|nr:hypothetical protein [Nitrosopumilus sp.]MDA7944023.1 hypothetical protein [Nitrosopumilus sp.]MDA7953810.1 hypothetical protein [Nitrosopumilus sp.]MDA7999274.1 hypothetical protein [Nitrosopumilus sp.]
MDAAMAYDGGKAMDRVDMYVLAAVGADDKPVSGKTKLQKILFLYSRDVPQTEPLFGYRPYNFGPYSDSVNRSFEDLVNSGMISDSYSASLTDDATSGFEAAVKWIGERKMRLLAASKEFIGRMGHNPMLAYIYSKYPDMSKASIRYRDIMARQEEYIVDLANDRIISTRCAAKLLNMEYVDFLPRVDALGISESKTC